jgi:hypothetical protein
MTLRSTSAVPFSRRARGRPPCCSSGFLRRESAILRAHAASGGKRGSPVGTSEERERVLFSELEWPSKDRETSGVLRRRQRRVITTCVYNVRKKATLGSNQRRRVVRNVRIQLCREQRRRIRTKMRFQYESYRQQTLQTITNMAVIITDLNKPLLIGYWSVTDFTSLLPIGLPFVTDSI